MNPLRRILNYRTVVIILEVKDSIDSSISTRYGYAVDTRYKNESNRGSAWKSYIVFQCSPTSETRGLPLTVNKPCMKYSVRASKFTEDEIKLMRAGDLQCKCSCGYRPRKSYGNVTIFRTRWEANQFAKMLNEMEAKE